MKNTATVCETEFFDDQGAACCVSVSGDCFSWRSQAGRTRGAILLEDVISAVSAENSAAVATSRGERTGNTLTVYYIRHYGGNCLGTKQITFTGASWDCKEIARIIQESMGQCQSRPRHLLAFVNPSSGHKNGLKTFRSKAMPIFEMAGIKIEEIVTTKSKEAKRILETISLSAFDGVVIVGGDGMVSEVINGLMLRSQTNSGINYDSYSETHVSCMLPVGIIPAGSGDITAKLLHGTRDVETATLKIVQGKRTSANIYSLHQGERLSGYSVLVLGFGLSGDIINRSEKNRWMGEPRYTVMSLVSLIKHEGINLEVSYLPATQPGGEDVTGWEMIKGRYVGIDSFVVTLTRVNNELKPMFGEDHGTVILIENCTRTNHLKYFQQLQNLAGDAYDFSFIKLIQAKAYKIRIPNFKGKYYLNCDGEVIKILHDEFYVKVHNNLVSLFGVNSKSD